MGCAVPAESVQPCWRIIAIFIESTTSSRTEADSPN
jgi:hypothetical protein